MQAVTHFFRLVLRLRRLVRREHDADAIGAAFQRELPGILDIEIGEAEEGRQRVAQAGLVVAGDDAAHREGLLRAADAHLVADLDLQRVGQVFAHHHLVAAREEGRQGRVGRVQRQHLVRDGPTRGIHEEGGDELRASAGGAVGQGQLYRLTAGPGAPFAAPFPHPLIDQRERVGVQARSAAVAVAGKAGGEAEALARDADGDVAVVAGAQVAGERFADTEAEAAQGNDGGHAGGDGEDGEERPAPVAPETPQCVSQIKHGVSRVTLRQGSRPARAAIHNVRPARPRA